MSTYTAIKSSVISAGLKSALPLIAKLSTEQLLRLVPRIPVRRDGQREETLRDAIRDDAVILNLLRKIATTSQSPAQIAERIRVYVVNPFVLGNKARREARKLYGFDGLSSISITPTVICNLHCDLCYATPEIHYDPKKVLPVEVMDRVMREAKELGAYRTTFVGGEPLIRWTDIRELARIHSDVLLSVFTNGLLVTDKVAAELAALGNVELVFSIDGLEETNDRSRGEGTFRKILAAMARFRDAGGLVVYAPTVTSENYREILSDEFIDLMLSMGCYMGYYHHYDMIGGQTRSELLLNIDQLQWMDRRITELAATKPISIIDSVLARLLKGGCHSVREFVHVNHHGQVEPCCMVPFAADSVYEKPLVDILRSKFMGRLMAIEKDSHGVKRCLVGDNTHVLQAAVDEGIAVGTTRASNDLFEMPEPPEGLLFPTCFSSEMPAKDTTSSRPRPRPRKVSLPVLRS